ncbi:hypothetical protein XENTR_v10015160 [Xenopus tropicalis]|nr:hypothetical protein XENTR_v10015160 [Xenopus tropicalis]
MFPLSAPVPSLPSFQHHLGPLGCLSSSVTSAVSPRASLPPVTSAQRSNAFRTVSMAAGCSAISHRLVTAEGEEFKSRDVKVGGPPVCVLPLCAISPSSWLN